MRAWWECAWSSLSGSLLHSTVQYVLYMHGKQFISWFQDRHPQALGVSWVDNGHVDVSLSARGLCSAVE